MKRLTAVLLLVVLIFALVACGSEDNTHQNSNTSFDSEESTNISDSESHEDVSCGAESSQPIEEGQLSDESKEQTDESIEMSENEPSSVPEESNEPAESSQPESSTKPEESSEPEQPVHTHSYSKKVTEPTCAEKGCEIYTCSCGDMYTVDIPTIPHSYSEPTCTSSAKCSCGAIGTSALGHLFSEGQCYRCGISDPNYTPPSNNTEKYTNGLKLGECMWGNGYAVWGVGTATDTDIIIPSTYNGKPVIEIYENAFKDCTNIISVSIPSSVVTIGTEAFSGCISLETVSITEGLTGIQSKAFYNCDSLKQINIPNSIENISKDSFEDCDNLKYNEFNNGIYLGNQSNPYVVLMTAKSCEDLFINNKTAIIAHNALSDNLEIKQVVVSDSVRFIGRNAFLGCKNLTKITFGDGLERIYINAFKNCTALTSVVFAESHSWGVNKYGYNTNLTIISTNDASTNAYNLKNKYCEYFWERAK